MTENDYMKVKSKDTMESDHTVTRPKRGWSMESDHTVTRPKRCWSRFSITTEPLIMVINFTMAFTSGITIDLLQDTVCINNFNMTMEQCNGELSVDIKSAIEAMTADVNMVNNIIQGACPVLLSLIIGPWSDTNGRKPFIKWSLRGYTTFYLLWGLLSLIPNLPVMCFVIPAIPLSLSGGWVAILVCTWSYIGDTYDEKDRPLRLAVLLFSGTLGSIVGNTLAARVFYACGNIGYQVMFFTSALLGAGAVVYATFILEESVTWKGEKTRLIDAIHLKSIFVTLLLKPRHNVIISLLTMFILASEITANAGDNNFIYLVGKSEFRWTLGDYNLFSAITTAISAVSPIAGVWIFQTKLGWPNYAVLTVFSFLMLLMNLLKASSVNETMFWITACLLKCCAILAPCIDTEMSKIVYEKDLGKAYAFSSLIDALSPVVSMPLVTELYKYLLPDRTLYVFFLKGGLSTVTFLSSATLFIFYSFYRTKYWNSDSIPNAEGNELKNKYINNNTEQII